jgi:hypothetical protein
MMIKMHVGDAALGANPMGMCRFGLFCITFMYFRSMVLLRREKESWGGRGDAVGGKVSDTAQFSPGSGGMAGITSFPDIG